MGLFSRLAVSSALAKSSNQQILRAIGSSPFQSKQLLFGAVSFSGKHSHFRWEDKVWK
jgi:hypothetical protein